MKNKNKKKNIFLYAGVLLAIVCLVGVGSAVKPNEFIEKSEGGCNRIYDVNRDGVINFQDVGLAWTYAVTPELHDKHGDLLYDVNMDGQVNFQDAGCIWINRD